MIIKKKRDDSYISINRRKRNKYLKLVGIPIGIAVIVLGVIVATQAQEHGLGAKIVYHIHPNLNMTVDGKPVTVPQGIGINSSLYKDHSLVNIALQRLLLYIPTIVPGLFTWNPL